MIERYSSVRYCEFKDSHSNKFYEVSVTESDEGASYVYITTTRWGKIGTVGTCQQRYAGVSLITAESVATSVFEQKIDKGYKEVKSKSKVIEKVSPIEQKEIKKPKPVEEDRFANIDLE